MLNTHTPESLYDSNVYVGFFPAKNYRNDENKPRRKEHYLILQLSKEPEKNANKISIFAKSRVKISLFALFSTFTNFVNATSASAHTQTERKKHNGSNKKKLNKRSEFIR